jgi:putative colanic acid biosysnthesis UDP-glucose lipid carrier transferase
MENQTLYDDLKRNSHSTIIFGPVFSEKISNTINLKQSETNLGDFQRRGYSKLIRFILLFADLLLINIAFSTANVSNTLSRTENDYPNDTYKFFILYISLSWITATYILDTYNTSRVSSFEKNLRTVFIAIILHVSFSFVFILVFDSFTISTNLLLLAYGILSIGIIVTRILFTIAIKKYRASGKNFRRVVIISQNNSGSEILSYIQQNPSLGYQLIGTFDDQLENIELDNSRKHIGGIDKINHFIQHNQIDEIYCALPFSEYEKIQQLIRLADSHLVRLKLVPDFKGLIKRRVEIDFYDNTPVMTLRHEPLENYSVRLAKRIFDIVFSSIVIIIGSVTILPVVALLIKLSSKGPVFFIQKRTGLNKKTFPCFKFRTMVVNEQSDEKQAQSNDSRITGLGNILRKTSIDELPQFLNVLLGHMSVVGPRPHMLKHTDEYSKIIDDFMVRHFAKPGITGWAQVNGLRGNTSENELMRKRVEYDVWYIENYTFITDIKIIFLTVLSMIKGDKNAY